MGMYTQARGWLNVDSISYDNKHKLQSLLQEAKESFKGECNRDWVCHDTVLHFGGNGSAYLFFGTELKNYDNEAEKWIEHLIQHFPNAEGRIDFQYECVSIGEKTDYWLIHDGEIVEKSECEAWCKGYGNMFE